MGGPVAQRLVRDGYRVKGSTTDPQKLPEIAAAGIEPFLLRAQPDITGDRLVEFFDSETLVLTLPFRRDFADPAEYRRQITSVMTQAQSGSVERIIFTSSTSVYTSKGEEVCEDDAIEPVTPRQQVLLDVEQDILKADRVQGTVIRFGGLYGGSRELGRFLSQGRAAARDSESRVNLIHLDDCVEIVCRVLSGNVTGEILNAVSDGHPTRRELYTHKARQLGLPEPVFSAGSHQADKIVSNRKIKTLLAYTFIHPDPLE